jgi:hypothetical protein
MSVFGFSIFGFAVTFASLGGHGAPGTSVVLDVISVLLVVVDVAVVGSHALVWLSTGLGQLLVGMAKSYHAFRAQSYGQRKTKTNTPYGRNQTRL